MKSLFVAMVIAICLPASVKAEETKGFWASLVPDNSSALGFVENTKSFFGQFFEDSKNTGKTLIDGGIDVIDATGDTIKSITKSDE